MKRDKGHKPRIRAFEQDFNEKILEETVVTK